MRAEQYKCKLSILQFWGSEKLMCLTDQNLRFAPVLCSSFFPISWAVSCPYLVTLLSLSVIVFILILLG